MEQSLNEFFKSERFLKFKRNLKAIEDRKRLKQIQQANKDIKNLKNKIFKQISIPKSIYNGRN